MSAIDNDSITVYTIPENFIDEGRIIKGMFKTRNFIEGVVMALVVAIFANMIPAGDFTVKITIMVAFCGPFFMLGINGFNGDSVFQTARNAYMWLKARTVVLYNGRARALVKSPLEYMMEQEAPADKLLDYMERLKQKRIEKRSANAYVENVNFRFADDSDLAEIYADATEDDDGTEGRVPEDAPELQDTTHYSNEEQKQIGGEEDLILIVDEAPPVASITAPTGPITLGSLDAGTGDNNNSIDEVSTTAPLSKTEHISVPLKVGLDLEDEELF